jgi:hypothetical protein
MIFHYLYMSVIFFLFLKSSSQHFCDASVLFSTSGLVESSRRSGVKVGIVWTCLKIEVERL